MFDPRGGGMTANADRRPGQGAADRDETVVGVVGNQATGGEDRLPPPRIDVTDMTAKRKESHSAGPSLTELTFHRLCSERLDLVALGEVAPPAPVTVLPGFLSGTVGLLTGRGGRGKSLLAMRLALAAAMGGSALSFESDGYAPTWQQSGMPGRVIVIALEDPADELHRRWHRLYQWAASRVDSQSLAEAARRVEIFPWAGRLPGAPIGMAELEPHFTGWLANHACGARLVVIDTLRRAHAYDENSSSAMSCVMHVAETIAHESGAALLVTHHERRAAAEGPDAARGSTVITDHARWVARLAAVNDESAPSRRLTALDVVKANYGRPAARVYLSLDTPEAVGIPVAVAGPGVELPAAARARWGVA